MIYGLPNFQAKMYVYVKPTNKSIVHLPIIIRGIGGNGKIRNCTCYVTYITPEDYVRKGKNLSLQARYDEAVRSYDKAIEVDPTLETAWSNKGWTLAFIGKYNDSIIALRRAIE